MANSPSAPARPSSSQRQQLQRNPSSSRTAPIAIGSASSSRRQSLQLSANTEQFPAMPQRHSRPFTPAELHSELEREQEGIINRLSRELQALREHSSIASTTSATSSQSLSQLPSAALQPPTPATTQPMDNPLASPSSQSNNHLMSQNAFDPTHPIASPRAPTASRQHRSSSSSLSNTSRTQSMTSSVALPSHNAPATASQASVDRARDAAGIPDPNVVSYFHTHPTSRSRAGSMRSGQPSPNLVSHFPSHAAAERRSSVQQSASKMEEANAARDALHKAKTENDELVEKIKSLEKELRALGGADEARGRTGQPAVPEKLQSAGVARG